MGRARNQAAGTHTSQRNIRPGMAVSVCFHVADRTARASIQSHGLLVRRPDGRSDAEAVGNRAGVYLLLDNPLQAASELYDPPTPNDDVWEVTVASNAVIEDPGSLGHAVFSPQAVSPDCLRLLTP